MDNNTSHPQTHKELAALWMASSLMAEMISTSSPETLAQRLAEQVRELTGAHTVLLMTHSHKGCRLIHTCPTRRTDLFSAEELEAFCPKINSTDLPIEKYGIPDNSFGHMLTNKGVSSLLRIPLIVNTELFGLIALLDLPEPNRIEDVQKILTLLAPFFGIALKNTAEQQRIKNQEDTLEEQVQERTQELNNARRAALNMMEDAVRARDDIAESERRYSLLLSNLPGIAYRCKNDLNWTMEFISHACEPLLGYAPEELINNNTISFSELIHPEDQERTNNTVKKALSEKSSFEHEYRVIAKNGQIKWVWERGAGIYDDNGNILDIEGFISDITKRKQAEKAVKESRENLQITLNSIGDAVISTNIEGHVDSMNPVAEELTGWKKQDALGLPLENVFRIINEFSRKPTANPREAVLQSGKIVGLANHSLLLAKDGREIPVADSGSPIINNAGEITGVVLVFRDQTKERMNRRFTEFRLELTQYSATHSLDKTLTRALDLAGKLMRSPIGFYHTVTEDQQSLILQQWSTQTAETFCKAEGPGMHVDIEMAGIWADCVREKAPAIHNDYASMPNKKGMPKGHAKIVRELVVPIIRKEKVVSVLGVGNKSTDYTDEDVRILNAFADITWVIIERKQSEKALQQSETQYRMLFENMATGFALHEMIYDELGNPCDYRFLEINTAFEQITGLKAATLVGRTIKEVLPNTESYWIKIYGQVATTGDPISIENYSKELDKHFDVRAFCPAKGQFATLILDITSRIETQKAIQESQSRLQRAQQVAQVGDWEFDLTNNIAIASKETKRIYGIVQDRISIAEVKNIPLPQYRAMLDKALHDLIHHNIPYDLEFKIKHLQNGRLLDVHSVAEYNPEENRVFGVIQDITARKKAELSLVRSETKYRDLFEKSADAFLIIKDERFIDCNQAAVNMLHYTTKEQLLGKRPEDLSPKKQPDGKLSKTKVADLIHAAQSNKTIRFEWIHQKTDGETFPVEVSLTALTDSEGNKIIHTTWRDISEHKRMQEAIEKRIIALTQPLDRISDISFETLFCLEDIQRIQDDFSNATGVASIILLPDGTPVTHPSNFTRFCTDCVRGADKGRSHCLKSDTMLIQHSKHKPFIGCCQSAELWEAGTNISVGGKHIATWLIGQVRNETPNDEAILKYAHKIGAKNEPGFLEAFHEVPIMSCDRFKQVAQALITLAEQLSTTAYQNIQQARFISEQKKVKEDLQESQSQLEIMWHAMNVGILLIDAKDHHIINANPALLQMSGYRIQEIKGHSCHHLLCPSEEGYCPADRTEDGTERSERKMIHAKGHAIDVEKTVTKILLKGQPAYLETVMDITNRKAAEKELKELSEIQSSILNNSSLGIALIENREFRWVNPRLCELLNTNIEELTGSSTQSLYLTEKDYLCIGEQAYHVLSQNKRFNHVLQFVKHDGSLFWCRLIGKALDPTQPLKGSSIWMFEDISDRKEAEEKLVRLSTAIEQSPEAIVITDTEGDIQYVNPAFEKTTGYTETEVLGHNPRILKSEEHPTSFYKELWETITNGNVWEGRIINRHKNGNFFTEEASIAPVKDSNGRVINYVAVKRDITEELIREEEFHHAQKMEAVGQLAGGIAHDFNNILQGILSFSELLQLGMDKDSEEYDFTNEIRQSATRAARLTKQLLAFSRKQPTEYVQVVLNSVVRDSEALLNVLLGENIKLNLNLQENLPRVIADYGQLSQIIMNLSVNARDAMPSGGDLSISTKQTNISESDALNMAGARKGEFVCLSIQDTGFGMDADIAERIFEPFFTTKPLGSGTGLGLSVVYGIVNQCKGWISLHSEPDRGTCFKVFFPIPKLSNSLPEPESLSLAAKQYILFVGDDSEMCQLALDIFNTRSYAIAIKHTTEDALNWLAQKENDVDLLISDMDFPDMNEKQFAQDLHKSRHNLPVLLLSGFNNSSSHWKNMEKYGIHLLKKPFTITTLLKTTSQLLQKHS